MVDIGVNLTNRVFRDDRSEVVARARDCGVTAMVVTGTDVGHSAAASDLARACPGVLYATAGVHPHHAGECDDTTLGRLADLAAADGVVAVGECGLDFNRDYSARGDQAIWFEAQLELAAQVGLPVFLHQRDAHGRFLEILSRHRHRLRGAVAHCFTGGPEELAAYLDLDLHIGVTGWICDERRGAALREAVARIPPQRLMLETDAPYLLPRDLRPVPKGRRNEPMYLPHICAAVARCSGRTADDVAAASTATARAFFRID
ncbi:MAG: TatD family hydrolase [Gammaproteobacteria bacterium]